MAEATSEIEVILQKYVRELIKNHVRPAKLILFGSHARGTATTWSDIDLSIISDDLEGKGILERQLILGRANQDLQAHLDVVGYTTQEWAHSEPGTLLHQILKTGKEIPFA